MSQAIAANPTGTGVAEALDGLSPNAQTRRNAQTGKVASDAAHADAACACEPGEPRRCRRRPDRGEGVISTAIAVLIVAFLGAAMWVAFNSIWDSAKTNINEQVNSIGSTAESGD